MPRPLVLLGLVACESGLSRHVDLVVPDAVAEPFTPEAPGVLVADLGAGVVAAAALCGQLEPEPLRVYVDQGFGCLRDVAERGDEVPIAAWIEPVPAAFTASALCEAERDGGGRLRLPEPGTSGLSPTPAAEWAQGAGTGVWHRDASPCGGTLDGGEIVVAAVSP